MNGGMSNGVRAMGDHTKRNATAGAWFSTVDRERKPESASRPLIWATMIQNNITEWIKTVQVDWITMKEGSLVNMRLVFRGFQRVAHTAVIVKVIRWLWNDP